MQIGIPRGKVINGRLRGPGGQKSRSQEPGGQGYTWKPGGDVILEPLSQVDRRAVYLYFYLVSDGNYR